MSHLYHFRVQKTREHFAEFAETIKEGKPDMQLKEIVKYIVSQLFKYRYFHGFVTQELRFTEHLKSEMSEFYELTVSRIDEAVKKGVASGLFTFAPKAEDILSIIMGTTLFTIRNPNFIGMYVKSEDEEQYMTEAEKKVRSNMLFSVFAMLGYTGDQL